MTTAPSSVHHRHHFARFFSVHPGVLPCPIMISAAFWTMHGNRDLRKAIQDDPVPIPVGTGLPVIGHVIRMSGIDLPEG